MTEGLPAPQCSTITSTPRPPLGQLDESAVAVNDLRLQPKVVVVDAASLPLEGSRLGRAQRNPATNVTGSAGFSLRYYPAYGPLRRPIIPGSVAAMKMRTA